ncbi:hypothetical protein H2198_008129 [Neophaeococcomyces mojaviensis]|uniref:Uncharacterized protein n=1 Tax=Neophaeococcomyces mojaviensis TaxID=3383035 RepID=A0ACC2ZY97_9EURO|nr:hypothetical protein H2198_008129 [Knufia sp. JES_112]
MAKLQKQLRHDQKKSLMSKHKVAKLTPAEIRSLNYSATVSKSGSVRSVDHSSAHTLASGTPPLTPDNVSVSYDSRSRRKPNTGSDLPTPSTSPARERRGSNASNRIIYAPKPLSHAQAAAFSNAVGPSRPPSQTSYRGVATYRGPEMTRSGSLTMLQRPSPQIVANPLSNFSRPRQSTLLSSPEKVNATEKVGEDNIISPVPIKSRHQSLGAVSRTTSRQHSPVRPSDSPVSVDGGRMPEKKVTKDEPGDEEDSVMDGAPKVAPEVPNDHASEPSLKQKLNWRKTLTGSLETDSEKVPLRKEYKRRTLMSPKQGYCLHAIHYADTKPGEPPQLRGTLKDELPSNRTSIFKEGDNAKAAADTGFGQHPAVRPLSTDLERSSVVIPDSSTSSSKKGKEREIESDSVADTDTTSLSSVPTYMRCDCCGRVQKPGGFASELSPVLENENLRTNFDFEVERQQPNHRRRSSSFNSGRPRFVPILPMEVGNETKQARIAEPNRSSVYSNTPSVAESAPARMVGVAINKPGDVIASSSMPLAIMPQPKGAPKFTRFASLHVRKEDKDENEEIKQEPVQNLPPPQLSRFGSLYGLRDQAVISQELQPQRQSHVQQMSAYQAQQARTGSFGQVNGNGYLSSPNSSHLSVATMRSKLSQEIYPDNGWPLPNSGQTSPTNGATQAPSSSRVQVMAEKGLDDTSAPSRNVAQEIISSPRYEMPEDEDELMVDLSSFDGSFVHGSLTRSATVLRDGTPPTTSYGQKQKQVNSASPPQPTRINTNVPSTNSPTSAYTSVTLPSSAQTQPDSFTTTPSTSMASTTSLASVNGDFVARTTTTTVVRILPSSANISASASPISTTSKGQLKLGDWVLPDSPKIGSRNIGAASSLNSSRSASDVNLTSASNGAASGVGLNGRVGVAA